MTRYSKNLEVHGPLALLSYAYVRAVYITYM